MITVANRIYVAREYAEAFEQDQSGFEFEGCCCCAIIWIFRES